MLSLFFTLPLPILVHILAASCALVLGPFVIWRRRRDRLHKVLGYVWVTAMVLVCLSSFGIHSFALIGPFSPIHALSIWALWVLWRGVRAAIRRDIAAHQNILKSLYVNALYGAGALTFLPGRFFNRLLFPDAALWGFAVVLAVFAALIFLHRAARNVTEIA